MTFSQRTEKKLYGSNSAFIFGESVLTAFDSGCLRSILIKSYDIRTTFESFHAERGLFNEERFESQISGPYTRETVIKTDSPGSGYVFSGRADFLMPDTMTVLELKSSESPSVLSEIIKGGRYKPENLAQLVAYMIELGWHDGQLIYSYYIRDKVTKVLSHSTDRIFNVRIADTGDILIDGKRSGFQIADLLAHRQAQVTVLSTQKVWPVRPLSAKPCYMCPFKNACQKFDENNISTDTFLHEAASCLNSNKGSNK